MWVSAEEWRVRDGAEYWALRNAIQWRGWLWFTTQNKQFASFHSDMTQRMHEQCHECQKTSLKRFSNKSWAIVSNAMLKSRRVETEMWSESLLVKRSLKTWSRAVSVLCCDQYADWKTCHKVLHVEERGRKKKGRRGMKNVSLSFRVLVLAHAVCVNLHAHLANWLFCVCVCVCVYGCCL